MVSDRGGKYGFVYKSRQAVYQDLVEQGKSQKTAAKIANAGRTRIGRSLMARKAASTRKHKRARKR